ncbi:glycosyltransferase [Caballeronia zhejiangensis]|uniref:glycosyltransferase n=1 Tax=Caballeronia zhejiangensis TaxID=871203 RepID=UPI00158923CE|nr:glycosyltransferase [Caballeronia zhejiangensis]
MRWRERGLHSGSTEGQAMNGKREVLFHIPCLHGGGAERVAVEIAKHFVSKGFRPFFFVHTEGTAYQLPPGVEVVVASKTGHLARVLELRALIRKRRPEAVLSFLPYANLISVSARLFGGSRTRLVISEHSVFAPSDSVYGSLHRTSAKAKIKWAIARWLYQASDSIVAVSTGVAQDLRRSLKGRAPDKVVVIHNPCFIPGAVANAKPRGAAVLAVGRLGAQKGFDVLIRAFASVLKTRGDATLVIAGEGKDRARLEALVRELGLSDSVSLPGFAGDVAELYRNADLFVCSSKREGFGNVIVEALSFGLPVVSTRCEHGPDEILDGGKYGRLVPVDDEKALAAAIIESLTGDVDKPALIARAGAFSLEAIGDRYLEQLGLQAHDDKATQGAGA